MHMHGKMQSHNVAATASLGALLLADYVAIDETGRPTLYPLGAWVTVGLICVAASYFVRRFGWIVLNPCHWPARLRSVVIGLLLIRASKMVAFLTILLRLDIPTPLNESRFLANSSGIRLVSDLVGCTGVLVGLHGCFPAALPWLVKTAKAALRRLNLGDA